MIWIASGFKTESTLQALLTLSPGSGQERLAFTGKS
jgi:hypothetical protein